jgi:flagellar biosynthesis protein FlhB
MTDGSGDQSDKPYDATPQKLKKQREKGEVAKSTDLSVSAAYGGLLIAASTVGADAVQRFGTTLQTLLAQPDALADLVFSDAAHVPLGGVFLKVSQSVAPFFLVPAIGVLVSILAQRAFVVAPDKVKAKLSRLSLVQNAKNKFGRAGWFEFSKSLVKMLLYGLCLGVFLNARFPDVMSATASDARLVAFQLMLFGSEFLILVFLVSLPIGFVDALWQHQDHLRKNRMSRKEVMDEMKDSEGDPHVKQQRRQRAQEIAMSHMLADVPQSDVIIVNPTHYAVALKWSRQPGTAPVCVAKGVDETAASIRRVASESFVPIHHDPSTARAIHATVDIGSEIDPTHFAAVAVSIRFAEQMRQRAKGMFT